MIFSIEIIEDSSSDIMVGIQKLHNLTCQAVKGSLVEKKKASSEILNLNLQGRIQ